MNETTTYHFGEGRVLLDIDGSSLIGHYLLWNGHRPLISRTEALNRFNISKIPSLLVRPA
jgi:hypothetical protein